MPTRIAVVGGGIAGLALAAALDPRQADVTLYEAEPDRRGLGTALAVWPGAARALARIGAGALLSDGAVVVPGGAVRSTADGSALLRIDTDVCLVDRPGLLGALDAVVPGSVARVTARVDDPPTLEADLVVGADGAHSVVRRHAWGDVAASRPTAYLAVRGLVGPRDAGAYGEYWGRGELFGISPCPGERTNWFCAYRSDLGPRHVDVNAALDDARARFAGLAAPLRDVLAEATPDTSLAQRIWVAPPLRSYVRGGAVLIGDAAHAMTPNLGRGACESLVDAVVLGDALGRLPLTDALRDYDRRRVARTQALRLGSEALMRLALARRAAPARDRLLRLAARIPAGPAEPARATA